MHVIVIGGGVVGLCTAYYLRKAGMEVTVIERNNITDGCSFGNMGYISPSHFIPIATPGIIAKGLKWMLSSSSPFYIKPRFSKDLFSWALHFYKSANAKEVEKNAPHLNNLLQLSRELMVDIGKDLPGSFHLTEKGCWVLYKSAAAEAHEKELAEQALHFGLRSVVCTRQEVQGRETEVEVDVAGGVLYLDDCHLDPAAFMRTLFKATQQMGVKFWLNTEVIGFEKENGKINAVITDKSTISCDEIVMANGSWMGALSAKLGLRVPIQPGKGYSMVYENLEKNLQYPSILVDHRTAATPIDNWLRIGGTMELSGHSDNILPKRVMAIYNAFRKYYPSMKLPTPNPKKAWFGYRPVSPDGLPYVGRHPRQSNLLFAGGHAMLGVSAAAGTGQLIKEILTHQKPSIDLVAFRPERFSA